MGGQASFLIRPTLFLGVATLFVGVGPLLAQAQPKPQRGELDASPALFTVLAAINAESNVA